MMQRSWSSSRTLIVAAIAASGLTGCLRAPSTVAAVPLWVAPVGIGVILLLAVGLRVLSLFLRRRRNAAGPGVTAQLARAQPQPQPQRPVLFPPSSSPGFGLPPFGGPAPLTGLTGIDGADPVGSPDAPPPPPAFASTAAPSDPDAGPAAGWYSGPAVGWSSAPVAGWYPDPGGRHAARYWDGASWTRHTQ